MVRGDPDELLRFHTPDKDATYIMRNGTTLRGDAENMVRVARRHLPELEYNGFVLVEEAAFVHPIAQSAIKKPVKAAPKRRAAPKRKPYKKPKIIEKLPSASYQS